MKFRFKALSILVVLFSSYGLYAETKVVFVHGRSGKNHCGTGTTDVNNYWNSSKNFNTSYTRVFAGYDGSTDPRDWGSCRAQSSIWTVLYNNCRGGDECYVVCHSAGCYAMDYFLSQYGFVTDNSGYNINIKWVFAVSGASGGSELADLAFWEGDGMVYALKTGNARSFNHNATGGVASYHISGYDGWWYSSWRLPGEDDGAVSFHTTCGKNSTGSYDDCQTDGYNWANHYVWQDSRQSGFNADRQSYNRDHDTIKDAAREMWNRLFSN